MDLRQICILKLFYGLIHKWREDWRQVRSFLSKCLKALRVRIVFSFFPKPILRCIACPSEVTLHVEVLEGQEQESLLLFTLTSAILTGRKPDFLQAGVEKCNMLKKKNPLQYMLTQANTTKQNTQKWLEEMPDGSWEDQTTEEWLRSQEIQPLQVTEVKNPINQWHEMQRYWGPAKRES